VRPCRERTATSKGWGYEEVFGETWRQVDSDIAFACHHVQQIESGAVSWLTIEVNSGIPFIPVHVLIPILLLSTKRNDDRPP